MMHPLLHLIATKPHLLGDHVEAYTQLIGAELDKTTKRWISKVVFAVVGLFLLAVGLIFIGVALMLWGLLPADDMNSPWLLIAVPVLPVLAGGFCLYKVQAEPDKTAFGTVREQLSADLAMLRQLNTPT